MTDHEQLTARLEVAEAGTRELSDKVLLALGWKRGVDRGHGRNTSLWRNGDGEIVNAETLPPPTESVDDGLALLREMGLGLDMRIATRVSHVRLLEPIPEHIEAITASRTSPRLDGWAATPALALSAALVRTTGRQKDKERP